LNTPPIITSLSKHYFDQFFGSLSGYQDLLSGVYRVDPEEPYSTLVDKINSTQAKILVTAWDSRPLPESFLNDCPTLRYVCHLTGEMRWLIPRKLIEEGLLVTNWGSAIADTVAEGALYLILASLRRATNVTNTMHLRKGWELSVAPPESLLDKRVGIHGFGNIAQQLTLLLQPFRCQISAYSPPVPDPILDSFSVLREDSLENLFERNDIIVEVEALTGKTENMIGKDLLKRIRANGIFVNIGRGKLVREKDLEEIAREGKIFIGLDVYNEEPLSPDSPLRGLENVFLVPHQGGPTIDRISICAEHALANIHAYNAGRPLESLVGINEYDRMT